MSHSTETPVASGDREAGTRERLLDAAEKLFSERGFSSTSVRDITNEAGCNVASVNYYFGSKEELYAALFRDRMKKQRELRLSGLARGFEEAGPRPTIEQVLSVFVNAFMAPLVDPQHGERLLLLFAREMIDRQLSVSIFLEEMVNPTAEVMVDALRRAVPNIDPRVARLSMNSVVSQIVQAVHMDRLFSAASPEQATFFSPSRMAEHIIKFSAGGIRAYIDEAQE